MPTSFRPDAYATPCLISPRCACSSNSSKTSTSFCSIVRAEPSLKLKISLGSVQVLNDMSLIRSLILPVWILSAHNPAPGHADQKRA